MNMDRITQESAANRAGIIEKTFLAVAIFAAAANGEVLARDNAQGPTDCSVIGDTCADGTIYVGISPDDGGSLFTTPADAPNVMIWDEAMAFVEELDTNGHDDWRVPVSGELRVLFENRDKGVLKDTFDKSGSGPSAWFWSATEDPDVPDYAWMKRFSGNYSGYVRKSQAVSVPLVLSEPRP